MKAVRFSVLLGLMLLISACTPQFQATPLATSTILPSATATATPNPSPTPTPIPTLFGGYPVNKLVFSWTTHSDLHFTSLDNTTSFDIPIAGTTHNNDYAIGPYWSPDGKWLIFTYLAKCADSCGIHLVDVVNKTDHLLNLDKPYFSIADPGFFFSWNSGNDRVITTIPYSSTNDTQEKHEIIIINPTDYSVTDTGIRGFTPSYSPINNDFVFMDCAWPSIKYYFVKEGSTEPSLITRVKWGNPFSCQVTNFIWSKDGKRIFFTAPHELQSVNLDGSDLHIIAHTQQDIDFFSEALSPDGRYMIVAIGSGTTSWQAGYIDLENDKLTMVNKEVRLTWVRSGQLIAFQISSDGSVTFFEVDPQTGEMSPVDYPVPIFWAVQP